MEVKDPRICVILARSGSKRLPKKNLQKINGKTLIEHAINCCTSNGITTIVSSDSNEILDEIKYVLNTHDMTKGKKIFDFQYNIDIAYALRIQ